MQSQIVGLLLLFLTPLSTAISCRSCHSWNNTACVRAPSTLLSKDCPEGDTACATVIVSATGHLFRGCSSDIECVQEGSNCVTCDEFRNCNTWLYPATGRLKCNICETSANANCATLPYYKQFEKGCIRHVADDQCVTIFDGFQVVRRECRTGLTEADLTMCEQGSNQCVACRGVSCNKITVRRDDSCLQCTSDAGNCANGVRASAVCGKVSGGICYNRLNVDGKLQRGCLSDLSEEQQAACLSIGDVSCETCHGTGCNRNLFPSNALQCVQCSSVTDLDCVQRQVGDALVKPCRLQLSGDTCYTRLHNDGTLDRGCYSDLTTPCDPLFNVTCTACEGAACNREIYPQGRRACYQCDGLDDLDCGMDQSTRSNASMVCRNFAEADGCYTLFENGKVKRGCSSDYKVDVCKGLERTQCQVCQEDQCNGVSEVGLRSSAAKILFNLMLLCYVVLQHLIIN